MSKIKKIEKELECWKASVKSYNQKNKKTEAVFSGGAVHGLELALAILKQPSNKVVEDVQAKSCGNSRYCEYIGHKCPEKPCGEYTPAT